MWVVQKNDYCNCGNATGKICEVISAGNCGNGCCYLGSFVSFSTCFVLISGQLIVASLLNRNVKSRLLLRDTEKATALFGEQDEEKLQVPRSL